MMLLHFYAEFWKKNLLYHFCPLKNIIRLSVWYLFLFAFDEMQKKIKTFERCVWCYYSRSRSGEDPGGSSVGTRNCEGTQAWAPAAVRSSVPPQTWGRSGYDGGESYKCSTRNWGRGRSCPSPSLQVPLLMGLVGALCGSVRLNTAGITAFN